MCHAKAPQIMKAQLIVARGKLSPATAISSIVDKFNYRGYTIEDLAANSTFEETVFLLWKTIVCQINRNRRSWKKDISPGVGFKSWGDCDSKPYLIKWHPMAWIDQSSVWDCTMLEAKIQVKSVAPRLRAFDGQMGIDDWAIEIKRAGDSWLHKTLA